MRQRGSALFLVLMAVVAISAGSMVILQQASGRLRLHAADRDDAQAAVLLADAERIAGYWLAEHGRTITTPLEDPYRATRIVDSTAEGIRITVDVWDACSGIACDAGDRSQILAMIPQDIHLDTALPLAVWWPAAASSARPVFPADGTAGARTTPPVCLVLSTWSAGRVNWRTAPWDVVCATLGRAGLMQREPVLRQARIGAGKPAMNDPADALWPADVTPVLVDETDRWCMQVRISAPDGRVRRWFIVLAAGSSGSRVLVRHVVS